MRRIGKSAGQQPEVKTLAALAVADKTQSKKRMRYARYGNIRQSATRRGIVMRAEND